MTHFCTNDLSTEVLPNGEYRVVSSLSFNADAGQAFIINSQCEVTNDTGHPVGVCQYLVFGTGELVAPATMENVTKNEHHKVFRIADTYIAPRTGGYTLSLVMMANSDQGGDLIVEKGYSQLSVLVL
jgi:hypothetical protein